MSNQKELTALIKRVAGQANILTIPRIYLDITGDHISALFLSQCVYWSDKGRGGWFYKSAREWQDELGLSPYQVRRCCRDLNQFIETDLRKANGAPTMHYRANIETIGQAIINKLDNGLSKNSQMDYEETSQSDSEITSQSLTETTRDHVIVDDDKFTSNLSAAFVNATRIPEGTGGFPRWIEALNKLTEAGVEAEDIEQAVKDLRNKGYQIISLQSIVNPAISAMSKRKGKVGSAPARPAAPPPDNSDAIPMPAAIAKKIAENLGRVNHAMPEL
jgi:hypothetical protein